MPASKDKQRDIYEKLRPFYDMGINAWQAHLQTKIAHLTCYKYFEIFHDEMLKEREDQIALRQRKAANQFDNTCSKIILNLNQQLDIYTKARQAYQDSWKKEDGPYKPDDKLERMYKSINELLHKVTDNHRRVLGLPFIDERTENATLERIQQHILTKTK